MHHQKQYIPYVIWLAPTSTKKQWPQGINCKTHTGAMKTAADLT